jgi:uncharacterized membrane protein
VAALLAIGDYWWGWGDLLFRWLHVVAAIAWIGSSFYFIALDHHLAQPADARDAERGVGGEAWEIHGGGFYRVEKFRVAPAALPEPLYWFKWEAYTTWLSGFALFVVVFFIHPQTFLVDRSVAHLSSWEAIVIAVGGLVVAWIYYDLACRLLGRDERLLAIGVFAFVVLSAYATSQLFAARAAYLEVGAMLGTIMAANVFFVIIPAHWELVRAKQAGREPDPRWNARGKQRSVHNNYFTLPVVFAMLSNHFPFTYGHSHAWVVLVCLMAIGALTRHFFNLRHTGRNAWWILAVAAAGLVGLVIWLRPHDSTAASAGPVPAFAQVQSIIDQRCVPCHALHPTMPGISAAPGGIAFDTAAKIRLLGGLIKTAAVDSHAMPPSNVTKISQAERDVLARWLTHR